MAKKKKYFQDVKVAHIIIIANIIIIVIFQDIKIISDYYSAGAVYNI